ncbi:glutathione S-transferase family protein [Photobacterium sp. WH77]|uniref:Glutathione S-transferase family protein n=1 Tax=Photobacterium arenosum TaxID=2774143 RepID=A0ABR9BJ88_9GAMM|nr:MULTISPECIES: glutathione S-transferase family protein [Photobacterium]MBD8512303.1 glutathione S-transferase family protein [Photobacterium arenosum]MBV7260664.1 glutathione S-transferase family protein [Photobacterium sp. WH24]MCG2835774.1 glutathione S-transferase family protein [Photobacterium sp. WH77]MCG2843549.1 glutathione S-transferase family protein [Photobacterium sp. WH80]
MILHGASISPFVRKIMLALSYKGLNYNLQPLNPYLEKELAHKRHPMGKVPVLEHDSLTVIDSTVIAHYLDDIYPVPPLYPGDAGERAKIRWLEEYADTRLSALLAGVLFYQKILRGQILEKDVDQDAIDDCIQHHLPPVLNYLEEQVPAEGYITTRFSMAEITLWSIFRSGWMAGLRLKPYYPKLAMYLEGIEQEPWVSSLVTQEDHELSGFYCDPVPFTVPRQ